MFPPSSPQPTRLTTQALSTWPASSYIGHLASCLCLVQMSLNLCNWNGPDTAEAMGMGQLQTHASSVQICAHNLRVYLWELATHEACQVPLETGLKKPTFGTHQWNGIDGLSRKSQIYRGLEMLKDADECLAGLTKPPRQVKSMGARFQTAFSTLQLWHKTLIAFAVQDWGKEGISPSRLMGLRQSMLGPKSGPSPTKWLFGIF